MKRIMIVCAVLALAFFLSGCFAILPQSDGYLSIDLEIPPEAKGPNEHPVVIFVANAAMEDSIKELLWLIDTESDEDRLVDVAIAVANRGLVKFGGDPFLRTTIPALSPVVADTGSFEIPGVPAERSYFVKVFVFGVGEDITSIEDIADVTVEYQNYIFSGEDTETHYSGWVPLAPFPIAVEAGETASVPITLDS